MNPQEGSTSSTASLVATGDDVTTKPPTEINDAGVSVELNSVLFLEQAHLPPYESSSVDNLTISVEEASAHDDRDQTDQEPNDLFGIPAFGTPDGRFHKFIVAWPRTFALIFGIFLPLWVLIGISCLSGFGLAKFEGPQEIAKNNLYLSSRWRFEQFRGYLSTLPTVISTICFEMYLDGQLDLPPENITDEVHRRFFDLIQSARGENTTYSVNLTALEAVTPTNKTAFYEQMKKCGANTQDLAKDLTQFVIDGAVQLYRGMSFSWIRCTPESTGLGGGYHRVQVELLQPAKQEDRYVDIWEQSRQDLFTQYYQANLNLGMSVYDGRRDAVNRSLADASGEEGCEFNFYAAAWFWFTIMTTVGYGNQSPATPEGRSMAYTLGFLSILAFGGVLAMSGYVSAAILDDAMSRCRCKRLNTPLVHCAIWGTCYYCWMLIIAAYARKWKRDRMDVHHTFGDMYWFSYVSTTSVGLGDMYLEPEVIIAVDLVTFPLLLLVGFTLFAAFLGKVSEIGIHLCGNRQAVVSNVVEQKLQKSTALLAVNDESKEEVNSYQEALETRTERSFHVIGLSM